MVTAHWIDTVSCASRPALLTLIDVDEDWVFRRLKLMFVTNGNGSDAVSAVKQLLKRLNEVVDKIPGAAAFQRANHIRCAEHSVQIGVNRALVFIKSINEHLRTGLVHIRRRSSWIDLTRTRICCRQSVQSGAQPQRRGTPFELRAQRRFRSEVRDPPVFGTRRVPPCQLPLRRSDCSTSACALAAHSKRCQLPSCVRH